jgi:hypothetical protein
VAAVRALNKTGSCSEFVEEPSLDEVVAKHVEFLTRYQLAAYAAAYKTFRREGGQGTDAYYDTTLDISWLADADPLGRVTFAQASAWATNLNVAGVTGWHLPTIHIDSCGVDGYGATFLNGGGVCGYGVPADSSDMAHMHLVPLGNISLSGQVSPTLTNTGPFDNLQAYGYWFSQDYAMNPWTGQAATGEGWRYSFHAGRQDNLVQSADLYAWAVHDGDVGVVAAVPEPQTYALMLAGLGVMGLLSCRRRPD